jgi:hypothetical protein
MKESLGRQVIIGVGIIVIGGLIVALVAGQGDFSRRDRSSDGSTPSAAGTTSVTDEGPGASPPTQAAGKAAYKSPGSPHDLATYLDVPSYAGRVASEIPGTPYELGEPASSILDEDTKRADVWSIVLRPGETARVVCLSEKSVYLRYAPPGKKRFAAVGASEPLGNGTSVDAGFLAAVAGTYYVQVSTRENGVRYTIWLEVQEG